jgi:hypothetical protein
VIDMKKRDEFDNKNGKVKKLWIIFEKGKVVFISEKIKFDDDIEKGKINVENGKLNDKK